MSLLYKSPSLFKLVMNLYPPYLGTGIVVREVAPDFKRVVLTLNRRFYNGNAFGTHFGGSLYSMCDPFYALMLIPQLGRDYIVWDKGASIEFVKPGRGTVTAVFEWNDRQLEEIRALTATGEKHEPERELHIVDAAGDTVARVHKTLYVRKKKRARG